MTPPGIDLALFTPMLLIRWAVLVTPALTGGILTFLILLRKAGRSPDQRLRMKGLELLLAGRPSEAEQYFRQSLAILDPSNGVRSLVCLADALMDQGRYEESKEYLVRALELGDPTGSGQGSMAELLLLTETDPDRVLDMADQAAELYTAFSKQHIYFTCG